MSDIPIICLSVNKKLFRESGGGSTGKNYLLNNLSRVILFNEKIHTRFDCRISADWSSDRMRAVEV